MRPHNEPLAPITPALREQFRAHALGQMTPKLRYGLVGGAVLFLAFCVWELVTAPQVLSRTLPLRVTAATVMVAASFALKTPWLRRRPLLVLHGGATWAAALISFLACVLPNPEIYSVASLTLVILVIATVSPSLLHHIGACALLVLTSSVIPLLGKSAPVNYLFTINLFTLSAMGLSSLLVFAGERVQFRAFRLEATLQTLAQTDALTGILNRRTLLASAQDATARSGRYGEPVTLLMVDIDRFKQINDTHGHPAGDEVIREVVRRLQSGARETDVLGRLGGEEFALLLPHTTEAAAALMAERLRRAVSASAIQVGRTAIPATLSLGVAELSPGEGLDGWMARADAALYSAKRSGRDRVCRAEPPALAHAA